MTDTAPRFHPELRRIARRLPRRPVTPMTLPIVRTLSKLIFRRKAKNAEVLTLTSGVGVRLLRPTGATGPRPALLWIHGGGYVMGAAMQDDELCLRYTEELGITVASVEYRLAPEHPYPAPVEDCYSALQWLATLPAVDRDRIAIGGASAGGGLAATLALLARDRNEISPVAQLLVYPMIDDRTVGADFDDPSHRVWNQASNRFGWEAYLGDADPDIAAPARRQDLSGLPPAWVGVGTLDLFHDEDIAYAERLRAVGVPCDVEVVEGAFHGFDGIVPRAEVSRAFFDSQCDMLRKLFDPVG